MPKPGFAPHVSGKPLRALSKASKSGPVRKLVWELVRKDLKIDILDALDPMLRDALPLDARPLRARAKHDRADARLGKPKLGAWPQCVEALGDALEQSDLSASELTDHAFSALRRLRAHSPKMDPIFQLNEEDARDAASESSERIAKKKSRSPLEGIPIAVKEEVDVVGLQTMLGTSWVEPTPASQDATVVSRLRAAGAVILGNTHMTEYGMSPLGFNAHREMPRNPHDPSRAPGGSSTGSAVGVATGAFPLALGSDGGGSIRIPSALNGIFGIKPTFGLISRTGDPFGGTVDHLGPISSSTFGLAALLDAVAGEDPLDPMTLGAPTFSSDHFVRALGRGVQGLKIGVVDWAFEAADGVVARRCHEALEVLQREGAELVSIRPLLFENAAAIGYVTIGLEVVAALRYDYEKRFDQFGPDLRILTSALKEASSDQYLDAQKLRARLRREVARWLAQVDVLAMPTTARGAPKVTDEDMRGFLETPILDAMCRYVFVGNLAGIPAGSAPIGLDREEMPIGLQILGDAWDDATVLQVMAHLERTGAARVDRPRISESLMK